MIFLDLKKEDLVQVGDKTRLDVSKTFVSGDAITSITIKPESSESAIEVFNSDSEKWYLDWAYATDGVKTITVEATDGTIVESKNYVLQIITAEDDNLYSSDEDIFTLEGELLRYIPNGRNSFKNIHREAQRRIINYLDRKRIWDADGTPYTKDQLNLENELRDWSKYEAISMIYSDLTISVGDKFQEKSAQYRTLRDIERDRGAMRIDKNSDGDLDSGEIQDTRTLRMILR